MNLQIDRLKEKIESLRQQIIHHKVYRHIRTLPDLQVFMQYHVYAVWDFMSLLKALQNNLTCTSIPWYPKGSANTRYLINEIVLGEESDTDMFGNRTSHFEMYLAAMEQCGADLAAVQLFLSTLLQQSDMPTAFAAAGTPLPVVNFVENTFQIIALEKNYLQAAVFTFGREDLIPGMFSSFVADIDKNFPGKVSLFKYYLDRHIEVDGGLHSELALQMTAALCGDNDAYWKEAEDAVIISLQKRIALWDAVYNVIASQKMLAGNG